MGLCSRRVRPPPYTYLLIEAIIQAFRQGTPSVKDRWVAAKRCPKGQKVIRSWGDLQPPRTQIDVCSKTYAYGSKGGSATKWFMEDWEHTAKYCCQPSCYRPSWGNLENHLDCCAQHPTPQLPQSLPAVFLKNMPRPRLPDGIPQGPNTYTPEKPQKN